MPTDAPAQNPDRPRTAPSAGGWNEVTTAPDAGDPAGRRWLLVHLAGLAVAGVILVWFNRNQWFFGDEWEFFVNRGFVDPALGLFTPHNEHWSTIPIVVYVALRDTVGIGSYLPYISVLIAVHLALTHLLWRAGRRAGVTLPILTVGTWVFALLGAGSENLLWAFQIGFVGSLAFGWGAALIVDHGDRFTRRDWWAIGLLVCSLMCSGIGIPAVAMVVLLALARARHPVRPLIVGGVPTAVFLVWYLVVPQWDRPDWQTPAKEGALAVGKFVVKALAGVLSGGLSGTTTGLSLIVSLALLAAVAGWAVVAVIGNIRNRPTAVRAAIAVAGLGAAAGFFLLSAFGRAQADQGRYVYVATAFALPGLLLALAALARPRWAQITVCVALCGVLVINVLTLRRSAIEEGAREAIARETVQSATSMVADGEHAISQQPDPVYDPDVWVLSMRELIEAGDLVPGPATADGLAWARLMLQTRVDPPTTVRQWQGSGTLAIVGSTAAAMQSDPTGQLPPDCLIVTSNGPNSTLQLVTPDGPATLGLADPEGGFFGLSSGETNRPNPAGVRQVWGGYPDLVPVHVEMAPGTRLNLSISTGQSIICGVARS